VVEVGLADTVPPVGPNVRMLPLVPLSVTLVALVAETVRVVELPLAMVVGLALTVTVGAPDPLPEVLPVVTVIVTLAEAVPPVPVAVAV